jgi:CheY-like chemotaxis protein
MTFTQRDELSDTLPGLGRRVLVVDDDPVQAKLLEVQLAVAGFAVTTVAGAAQALSALSPPPDVIVSDVLMDEMDGFSLCEKLRKLPEFDAVPIILLSTYFDEIADRALAQQVGANALVARTPSMQVCIEPSSSTWRKAITRRRRLAPRSFTYDGWPIDWSAFARRRRAPRLVTTPSSTTRTTRCRS